MMLQMYFWLWEEDITNTSTKINSSRMYSMRVLLYRGLCSEWLYLVIVAFMRSGINAWIMLTWTIYLKLRLMYFLCLIILWLLCFHVCWWCMCTGLIILWSRLLQFRSLQRWRTIVMIDWFIVLEIFSIFYLLRSGEGVLFTFKKDIKTIGHKYRKSTNFPCKYSKINKKDILSLE